MLRQLRTMTNTNTVSFFGIGRYCDFKPWIKGVRRYLLVPYEFNTHFTWDKLDGVTCGQSIRPPHRLNARIMHKGISSMIGVDLRRQPFLNRSTKNNAQHGAC